MVDSWLRSVERYANLVNITSEEQTKFAATLLRGRADIWLRGLETSNSVPENWRDFKKALEEAFKPTQSLRLARDKLAALRQVGTVDDYVDKFRDVALEIPNLSPDEAQDRFERGLRSDIRAHVRTMAP